MLKQLKTAVHSPRQWYARQFNLTEQEVRFSVWFALALFVGLNLVAVGLLLLGWLPIG